MRKSSHAPPTSALSPPSDDEGDRPQLGARGIDQDRDERSLSGPVEVTASLYGDDEEPSPQNRERERERERARQLREEASRIKTPPRPAYRVSVPHRAALFKQSQVRRHCGITQL